MDKGTPKKDSPCPNSFFSVLCISYFGHKCPPQGTKKRSVINASLLHAGKGTRTPTSRTPDPKSGASANSAIPAKPDEIRAQKKGWVKGFEPLVSRATIWRPNQLGHTHHSFDCSIIQDENFSVNFKKSLPAVLPKRLPRCFLLCRYRACAIMIITTFI